MVREGVVAVLNAVRAGGVCVCVRYRAARVLVGSVMSGKERIDGGRF